MTSQLRGFRAHSEEFDVLFVGSSRMKQLEPEIFDHEFAKAAIPLHSFNLAIDGLRPPEDSFLLERALAGRSKPVRLILIEGNSLAIHISDDNLYTERMIYWHDLRRMLSLWRRCWAHSISQPPSAGDALSESIDHLVGLTDHFHHYLLNAARAGRGSQLLQIWLGLGHERAYADSLGPRGDGFTRRPIHLMSKAETKKYAKSLSKVSRLKPNRADPADAATQEHFASLATFAQSHGATLVVIAPPTTTPEILQPLDPRILFLNFSNPSEYPELFAPSVRLNGSHLNDDGAKLFTTLVAKKLTMLWKNGRWPAPSPTAKAEPATK